MAVLAWLGLLLVGFAGKSPLLRRRPDALPWKPRPARVSSDRLRWPRAAAYTWLATASAALVIWAGALAFRALSRVDPATLLVYGPSGPNTP